MSTRYIHEVERWLLKIRDDVKQLFSRMAAVEQQAAASGGMGPSNGSSGGVYFTDPGATTIAAGSTASLTVYEIKASGDASLGSQTVINKYPDATEASKRLILGKTRDDAYVVIGQGCSTG